MSVPVRIWTAFACAAWAALAVAGEGQLSARQIVEKANHVAYYQGRDGRARVSMTITDQQGRQRSREFTILRRDHHADRDADQSFYVYFHRPADVNKMVFMVHKHIDRDDDRWLYLPALDLVKRVAASDERTSFVGSHFFYEDVSGRGIAEDDHELIKTTETYYVLKNTPRAAQSVEFASYEAWIDRNSFLPVRLVYYDAQGSKYRIYDALTVERIQDRPTVTKARMQDLRTSGNTVVQYSDVQYDIGLPEGIFAERYLRRPPRKYLR